MKNLLLSSLLLTLFSCGTYTENFKISNKKVENFTSEFLINSPKEKSFRMAIEAYGNNFSGNVVSKKLNPNHYRFAFLNEFGGKMLDFELINQDLKLNYAMEELDRKILLSMLEKDFNLLFNENNSISETFEFDEFLILKSKINSNPIYYYLKNDTLRKTVMATGKKEKINLQYSYKGTEFPDVEISHGKVKVKIYLHLLDSN